MKLAMPSIQSVSNQQQLEKVNAKLLSQFEVQNAEIIMLQDDLATSKFKVEFYQQEAEKAQLVPIMRKRVVHADADLVLRPISYISKFSAIGRILPNAMLKLSVYRFKSLKSQRNC